MSNYLESLSQPRGFNYVWCARVGLKLSWKLEQADSITYTNKQIC